MGNLGWVMTKISLYFLNLVDGNFSYPAYVFIHVLHKLEAYATEGVRYSTMSKS